MLGFSKTSTGVINVIIYVHPKSQSSKLRDKKVFCKYRWVQVEKINNTAGYVMTHSPITYPAVPTQNFTKKLVVFRDSFLFFLAGI